jgi:Fe-S oxidoreductase
MVGAHLLTLLFWVQAVAFAAAVGRRARLWAAGRPAQVHWSGLAAIPKRYFVDLHRIVARDPFIARAHVATAGGAVVMLLLIALNYGLALYTPLLDALIALAALAMLCGTVAVAVRRRSPPSRLSRGPWMRLPWTLAACAAGVALFALTALGAPLVAAGPVVAMVALLLILTGSLELAWAPAVGGPMKHATAGLLHLAFHPRPERFAGRGRTALKLLDLAPAPEARGPVRLGVQRPADFRWNQLLSFDACVECGKCEAACPAFAAGQPLNPKKLIQDLVVGMAGGSDKAYAGSPSPGLTLGAHHGAPDTAVLPDLIEPGTLWACTTCRACVEECPMLIEHVDAVIDLRRFQTLERGELPQTAAQGLQNLRLTGTQGGFAAKARYDWAVDLGVRVLHPGETTEYLLLGGEGAYDARYQRTLRAVMQLLQRAQVDFAILGANESDCGDLARRLGDEDTFQTRARATIEVLRQFTFRHILTADPHVLHCVRNEYPALGGRYDVVHHTALLAQLVRDGRLRPVMGAVPPAVTYHDPCYLGRYNGEFQAPRALLQHLGIDLREMQRSQSRARCCGGGGGAPLTDVPGRRRIPDMRMDDARETGAAIVAVACPGCTAMLEGVIGPRPEVLDVAEILATAVGPAP